MIEPLSARAALAYDLATARVLAQRDLVRFFRQPSRLAGALGQPVIFWLVIGGGLSGTFRRTIRMPTASTAPSPKASRQPRPWSMKLGSSSGMAMKSPSE